MYFHGNLGLEKLRGFAILYAQRAAEQNYGFAAHSLGMFLSIGDRTQEEYKKAEGYFLEASKRGQPHSHLHLGGIYEYRVGTVDRVKAYWAYTKAGDPLSLQHRQELVNRLMTDEERKEIGYGY